MYASLSVEDILGKLAPAKSKGVYDKAWADFEEFIKEGGQENEVPPTTGPSEQSYIKYFHHLRTKRCLKSSSLWAVYSRLNNCHQRRYGLKLQQWPRITMMLKQ